MRKTFKYRIYANRETIAHIDRWLELMRQLYNTALEERIGAWKMQHKSLSYISQQNELPDIRMTYPEYRDINAQSLRTPLHALDFAFQGFFRRIKRGKQPGFPRFKGRGRFNSFNLYQSGWKLDGKYLSIRNVGRFKLKLSRPIQGDIKIITIRKDNIGHWYACFSCDNVPEKRLSLCDKSIGLDVGIKTFLTDSEGHKVENPKCLWQSVAILRRKQRVLSKRKKGSHRRNKARIQVTKCHEKIANQRKDFHHKLASEYIKNYGVITIENLRISNMVRNRHLAESISDCAWGQFFEILKYKAAEAGREVIQVNPRNTSKTCSCCGELNHMLKLSDRTWVCKACGTVHDRDFNAAKNIKRLGQSHQEVTYANR